MIPAEGSIKRLMRFGRYPGKKVPYLKHIINQYVMKWYFPVFEQINAIFKVEWPHYTLLWMYIAQEIEIWTLFTRIPAEPCILTYVAIFKCCYRAPGKVEGEAVPDLRRQSLYLRLCSLPPILFIRSNGILGQLEPAFTRLIRIKVSQVFNHFILINMRRFAMEKISIGIDIAKANFVAAIKIRAWFKQGSNFICIK